MSIHGLGVNIVEAEKRVACGEKIDTGIQEP